MEHVGAKLLSWLQDERGDGTKAWDMCLQLKEKGLLAKPTHGETKKEKRKNRQVGTYTE